MRAQFITASEVAEIMGISRSKAYQIVREMNRELKSQGYHLPKKHRQKTEPAL